MHVAGVIHSLAWIPQLMKNIFLPVLGLEEILNCKGNKENGWKLVDVNNVTICSHMCGFKAQLVRTVHWHLRDHGFEPLNFFSAQMRQSLTLSSKCKDLFFNSSPNHSSETFLALTSWNQDESLCQRQVCWFLETIAPTTLLRWSLSDLDCINLSSFVRCSKLLHQGRDVAVLFH